MQHHRIALAIAMAFPLAAPSLALAQSHNNAADAPAPTKELGVVTVMGTRPSSLPTQIPTTMESVTREQIEQSINATDSEDALKYLPSLLVRKRYIGDYNHAILSSRASGTGNSARSAVYADGILLSNYLGNGVGGLSFPPRWGLVTPQEIERVDVMYGPFSAAYPGNSVGAVVDYVTRMPTQFEAHGKVGSSTQPFSLYNTSATYRSWETSASVGNKNGNLAWFMNFEHTDSQGQPLTFATRLLSSGTNSSAGTPVSGAVLGNNSANAPWTIIGTGTQYHTQQDHIKAKLAYDVSPTVRASYVLGLWQNNSTGLPSSYLSNAAGQSVSSGAININGKAYTGSQALTGGDFAVTQQSSSHAIHGLSLKSHTQGVFDWEVAASLYDYSKDQLRQNASSNSFPNATSGGAGTLADGGGSGWNNLALRGTWRPGADSAAAKDAKSPHVVDFGYQQDHYTLQYRTSSITGNFLTDPAGSTLSNVGGNTALQSLYAQDTWAFAPRYKAVLGLRAEQWTASNGNTQILNATPAVNTQWPQRTERFASPKAALSYQWAADTVLKASLGRAVRMPTVSELYGGTSTTNARFINDPNLQPEKSWTGELSAEKDLGTALLRLTYFHENTRDALYSQTTLDPVALVNVSRVQNIGRIETQGLELAYNANDVFTKGLDLSSSLTYAHSIIKENSGFVATPGDTIGKQQPNIPQWRGTVLAGYRWNAQWTSSLGVRYSGNQYRTLNNADVNGMAYQGVSKFLVADLRVRYQVNKQWSAAFGIDNLNNAQYWNFHPYPQRSYNAELKFDL